MWQVRGTFDTPVLTKYATAAVPQGCEDQLESSLFRFPCEPTDNQLVPTSMGQMTSHHTVVCMGPDKKCGDVQEH